MDKRILDAERSEQAVWSELYKAIDAETKQQLGASSQKFLDADCLIMSGFPVWFLNRVIGLGLEQSVTEDDIDQLIALYHGSDVPIGISLCPNIQTTQITRWLTDRGFAIANQWVKMARGISPPQHSNSLLRVEPARPDQADIVADIVKTGFELDEALGPVFGVPVHSENNRVYIAWDGDTPAAVGTLSLYGDVGHLNTAATLPEFRGRGAQGAIMVRRIQDGIQLGCKGFVTETWDPGESTNHSYNNMLRHGFELAYKRPNWVLERPNS